MNAVICAGCGVALDWAKLHLRCANCERLGVPPGHIMDDVYFTHALACKCARCAPPVLAPGGVCRDCGVALPPRDFDFRNVGACYSCQCQAKRCWCCGGQGHAPIYCEGTPDNR